MLRKERYQPETGPDSHESIVVDDTNNSGTVRHRVSNHVANGNHGYRTRGSSTHTLFHVEAIEDCLPFDTPEGMALDAKLHEWNDLTDEQQRILTRIRAEYGAMERELLRAL